MNAIRYVFAGNRFFVLQKMLELGLSVVKVYAVNGSYLAREMDRRGMTFDVVPSKTDLVQALMALEFDIFVCNGCPIILPVSRLTEGNKKLFINVHPSLLPDLRGSDPVPGAILHGRKSGATCQLMNDQIDAGDIIARVEIGDTNGLDVALLYQLSFRAERDVFEAAWRQHFTATERQELSPLDVYYTAKPSDQVIQWGEDAPTIVRRVLAFSNRSKGACFSHKGMEFKVFDADWLRHPYLSELASARRENEVCFVYERRIAVAKNGGLLILKDVEGDLSALTTNECFG